MCFDFVRAKVFAKIAVLGTKFAHHRGDEKAKTFPTGTNVNKGAEDASHVLHVRTTAVLCLVLQVCIRCIWE